MVQFLHSNFEKFVKQDAATDSATNCSFLTNCPKSLRRRHAIGQPLILYASGMDCVSTDIECTYFNPADSITVTSNAVSNFMNASVTRKVTAANLTPIGLAYQSSNGIFTQLSQNDPSNTAVSRLNIGKNITFKMDTGGTSSLFPLDFELVNNPYFASADQSTHLDNIHTESCAIYFVNDYNVLDFYLFESFIDISHNHTKFLFKTGSRDYTKRNSSKRGVSSATTEEVYTCSTLASKEASEWLSEIYRSKQVYLYDYKRKNFIPVIVIDAETRPAYANKTELQPFTLSFVKDVYSLKY